MARGFAAPQARASSEPVAKLETFADLMALIEAKRDISLKIDVERFVRPISFRPGAIEFEAAPGTPSNLVQRLVGKLKDWTGQRWLIAAQGGGGAESLWEKQKREEREVRAQLEQDPFVLEVMKTFPGTEIVGIRTIAQEAPAPEAAAPVEAGDDDDSDED